MTETIETTRKTPTVVRILINWVMLLIGLVAVVLAGQYFIEASKAKAKKKGAGRKAFAFLVKTAPARRGAINETVTLTGDVVASRQITIRSEIQGTIRKILFREGRTVPPNQTLLRFDQGDQLRLRDKQRALLAQARAALRRAQANLKRDRDDLARLRRLQVGRTITARELIEASFRVDASKAAVDEANAQISVQRHELSIIEADVKRTVIISPDIACIVSKVSIEEGDQVTKSAVLFELVGARKEIHLLVPARHVAKATVGTRVSVRPSRQGSKSFAGKIVRRFPMVDSVSRNLKVVVDLDKWPATFEPNSAVRAQLEVARHHDVLLVAKDAVTRFGNEWVVFSVLKGKAQRVVVTILAQEKSRVAVSGKFKAGDPIVVVGNEALFPNAPVRVIGPPKPQKTPKGQTFSAGDPKPQVKTQ